MITNSLLNDLLSKVRDVGKRLNSSSKNEQQTLLQQCEQLIAMEGEARGLALAQVILDRYALLASDEKKAFFRGVLDCFGADPERLGRAVERWLQTQDEYSARELHFASEPRSQNLFRRLNQPPDATQSLVNMRSDLLSFVREDRDLIELDKDFVHLFSSWFNRGFLELRQINWGTSAEVLEKIIAYEAVHEINGWSDLRQRVASRDRRLYGYFHPALGMEPLIFVEVALTTEVPSSIQSILQKNRPELAPDQATTAVFYSISNCQKGLKGISFGNFLIKQVVEHLRLEFPALETFITLSPVPGFRKWALQQIDSAEPFITEEDLALIRTLADTPFGQVEEKARDNKVLLKLLAKYLVKARHKNGGAVDPVARFHLGNGARLENMHLLGDVTTNGLKNSWGCMVNYQYHVDEIEKFHEAYANDDQIVISKTITHLLSMR